MSSKRVRRLWKAAGAVTWWGRFEIDGLERIPREGPVLLLANHDSQWDPVLIWRALFDYRPGVRFVARANLWDIGIAGSYMNTMGHIPLARGSGDARAIDTAADELRAGGAIAMFPEGVLSRGRRVRARSGAARLARMCPEADILLLAVTGTTSFVRFPRRPRAKLTVFPPASGPPRPDEDVATAAGRLMDEIRAVAPPVAVGRTGPIARRLRDRRQARRSASSDSAAGPDRAAQPSAVREGHALDG
jgi:1-acyl-sn-glycerol-3-phosphate acyltransferase